MYLEKAERVQKQTFPSELDFKQKNLETFRGLTNNSVLSPFQKNSEVNTFYLLREIYLNAGDIEMDDLWKLRINANFEETNQIRNDTEFFLPQIW